VATKAIPRIVAQQHIHMENNELMHQSTGLAIKN